MALTSIAKTVVLFLSLICIFTSKGLAQSNYYIEEPRLFYGGLLAGGNFSQVDGDNFAGYHKVGMNVGGIVYARMAEHVAASLEILYSQKGARGHKVQNSNNQAYAIQKYNINLNYAEVPIQINYFDKRKSHFGAGFSYSQLISGEEKIESIPTFPDDLSQYPFKKFDINFLAGGNLHLYKGLFLNVRFQYSVVSMRKKYHPEIGRAEQFNNMWTLRLMYLFQ
jgi:hypothetical protein